jgi:hypothetical protein
MSRCLHCRAPLHLWSLAWLSWRKPTYTCPRCGGKAEASTKRLGLLTFVVGAVGWFLGGIALQQWYLWIALVPLFFLMLIIIKFWVGMRPVWDDNGQSAGGNSS